MAEISKLNVSGVQYDVKDTAARNDIASIKEGSINLDQLVTTGSAEIGTDLTVKGNIIQQGETYETHAEKLYTKKDLIITRDGAESALTDGEYTGIQATKYDGITDGQLVFDKNGVARVGDIGYTQPLATRQDTPAANGVAYWNSDQSTFLTANPSFTIIADGAMSVAKTGTIGNLTGYVNGMSVKVLFPNGHYGSSFTLKLDNLTAKTIYVPSNGSVKEMESKSLDREDGNGTQPWYVQPFTTLELMYVESLGGGAGGWLVTGNPVVLSSSTSGYTIYADGFFDSCLTYIKYGERDLRLVLGVSSSAEVISWLNTNHDNPTEWLKAGIMIGDWVDIQVLGGTHRAVIAYLQSDGYRYSNYKPCIWMTFKNCIATGKMNSTDTNAGGYTACEMRTYLNNTVASSIRSAGFSPINAEMLECFKNGCSAWEWQTEVVFLPTETMVYGAPHWSLITDAAGSCSDATPFQLPYYSLKLDNRKKYYNGSNQLWWLMDPAYAYSLNRSIVFCNSNGDGSSRYGYASNVGGVCPCFIL